MWRARWALLVLSVCMSTVELSSEERETGTEFDSFPCASSAELAQLSGTIVYEGDPVEGADPARNFEVWVVGSPDWSPQLVAGGPGFDGHPAWSPDGRRIVYSSHAGRTPDLYVVNPDGSDPRRITHSEGRADYPKWLPEGIVYKSRGKWLIIDADDGTSRPYARIGPEIDDFALSPDGLRAVVVKRGPGLSDSSHLYLADRDGVIVRQLTNRFRREIHPAWSPDGTQIVYSGGDGTRNGQWEVFLLDVETGESRQVTQNPGADWACGWSPDGEWILMVSEYKENWDVYAIRPDGSNRIRITCHAGNARYATWTNTKRIVE